MKSLRPIRDNIIAIRKPEKQVGVIVSPREKDSLFAIVKATGPDVKILKPGDEIMLKKSVGNEVTWRNPAGDSTVTVIIAKEDQVSGIVE